MANVKVMDKVSKLKSDNHIDRLSEGITFFFYRGNTGVYGVKARTNIFLVLILVFRPMRMPEIRIVCLFILYKPHTLFSALAFI